MQYSANDGFAADTIINYFVAMRFNRRILSKYPIFIRMRRREFVTVGCCSICGLTAGCLTDTGTELVPEIVSLELRNDQREDSHTFKVQIENKEAAVFK